MIPKIPSDAKVIIDSIGDKYRADRLFFKPRKNFNFYFNRLFNKKTSHKEYYIGYFDVWFNKKTFPKKDYWYLAKYYTGYFYVWFNKKTFPKKYYWCLEEYCLEYKHIWDK